MPLPKPKLEHWPTKECKEGQNARQITKDEAYNNLLESVRQHGILQPLIGHDNRVIIAGLRRLAVARELDLPAVPVSAYPGTLTSSQNRTVNLSENLIRSDLTDQEIYPGVKALLEENPGMNRQDLAAMIGVSCPTITRWLCIDDLPAEAKQAFFDKRFGFVKAYQIAKSPDQLATLALVLGGATVAEAERRSRKAKVDAAPAVRASKIKVPLVSGATVTVAAEGVSMEEALEAVQEAAKQLKAAIAKGITAKSAMGYWKDIAAAG